MSIEPKPLHRIRDFAGLLAYIPSLLGFQPERSIVLVCLDDSRVTLSMRFDLNDSSAPANVDTIAETAIMAARRANAQELVAVAYVPKPGRWIAECLRDLSLAIETKTSASEHAPIHVRHMAAVGRDGWIEVPDWGTEEFDLRPLAEIADHEVAAQRVFEGKVVARSRKDVEARVRPRTEEPSAEFVAGLETVMRELPSYDDEFAARLMVEHLLHIEETDGPVADDVLAGMVGLLAHPLARDEAMLRITRESAERYVEVWSRAVRLTDRRAALAALFLAGTAAWLSGDGAMVNMCAEQGGLIDPSHIGVRVLTMVNSDCWPPSVFEGIKAEMLATLGRAA